MNPDLPQLSREELEVRLTALLLGELPAAEAGAMMQLVSRDADLAKLLARLERTLGFVRDAVKAPTEQAPVFAAALKLSPGRREKLLQHLKLPTPAQLGVPVLAPRKPRLRWWVPVGAAAVCLMLAAVVLPSLSRSMKLGQSMSSSPAVRRPADNSLAFRRIWGDSAMVAPPAARPNAIPSAPVAATVEVAPPNPTELKPEVQVLSQLQREGVETTRVPTESKVYLPAASTELGLVAHYNYNLDAAQSGTLPDGRGGGGFGGGGGGYGGGAAGGRGQLGFNAANLGRPAGEAAPAEAAPVTPFSALNVRGDDANKALAENEVALTPRSLADGEVPQAKRQIANAPIVNQPVAEAYRRRYGLIPQPAQDQPREAGGLVAEKSAALDDFTVTINGSVAAPGSVPPARVVADTAGAVTFAVPVAPASLAASPPPPVAAPEASGRVVESKHLAGNFGLAQAAGFEGRPVELKQQIEAAGSVATDNNPPGAQVAPSGVPGAKPADELRAGLATAGEARQLERLPASGASHLALTNNLAYYADVNRNGQLNAGNGRNDWYFDGAAEFAKRTERLSELATESLERRPSLGNDKDAAELGKAASSSQRGVYLPMPTLKGTPENLPSGPNIEALEQTEREQRDAWGVIAKAVAAKEPAPAATSAPEPALGNVPVVGQLFRSESKGSTQSTTAAPRPAKPALATTEAQTAEAEAKQSAETDEASLVHSKQGNILLNAPAADAKAKAELRKAEPEPPPPAKPTPPANAPVPQPEIVAAENPFSTFSLNIADVSFKLAQASLEKGVMPDAASIRSEEFVNAFDYRDPDAPPGVPIAFAWERARYPFTYSRDLLRFSLKTAAQGRQAGRPLNLVLLLDNSGSMERADRVRIIQECLLVLAAQLQPQDRLSVVTFARTARLWIDGQPAAQAVSELEKVGQLTPQGGTNLEEAMNLAYQTALRHYLAGGVNRVVLLTDGAANLGDVKADSLKAKVEQHRKQGIALDCFGIGWEGYNDDLLEVLTRNGDGRYGFVNTPEAASTEFAAQLAGALHVAASDVKVQVEFNPARVTSYRQIGYAKHQLTKEQFRDNTVDAAEIAAQEAGNALYVVETNPQGQGPIATVRVRYKVPSTGQIYEHEWPVPFTGSAVPVEQSGPAMRLALVTSAFSEWLAGSPFSGEVTLDKLLSALSGVPQVYGADKRPEKLEWMLRQAKSISGK